MDDNLESLQWLQDFSLLNASGKRQVISNRQHQRKLSEKQLGGKALASPQAAPASSPAEVDYKTNPHIKPPHSYATLICMAMQASKKDKITLTSIYKWLTDNFCYFRHANPTWKNTIRHNLTMNKSFIKVPRQKDELGKGGFWKVDPEYAEHLLTKGYEKRMMPPVVIKPEIKNQLKTTSQPDMTVPSNATGVLHVSPEFQHLLEELEEFTRHDQTQDVLLAETSSVDCRGAVKGQKRKSSCSHQPGEVLIRSSSSLLAMEEPQALASLKYDLDWDALLNSALNGDLSPIAHDQDVVEHGINVSTAEGSSLIGTRTDRDVDSEEEAFLAAEFLKSQWIEEFL